MDKPINNKVYAEEEFLQEMWDLVSTVSDEDLDKVFDEKRDQVQ